MHGRRRAETKALKRDPKISAKLSKKAVLWYQLQTELLQRRQDTTKKDDTLQLIANALSVNPDPLWLWNFRREYSSSWETEAAVTQTALESNPKSYGAWQYRKWCLTRNTNDTSILSNELALTEAFLQRDERNFHCWSYRRFVVSCVLHTTTRTNGAWHDEDGTQYMGAQIGDINNNNNTIQPPDRSILEAEWAFTEQKIRDNFSNFSAFHYRSKLLPILKKDLQDEFAIIDNAICTEPDDQTAWWYQSFLLDYAMKDEALQQVLVERILPNHIALLRELQEETENKSKWVLLGLLKTLSFPPGDAEDTIEEQLVVLQTLERVDADRKMRYKAMQQQLLSEKQQIK